MTLSLCLGVNREFDSNVIDESDSQDEKHFDPRISICPTPFQKHN
jgi:hypothetical protein